MSIWKKLIAYVALTGLIGYTIGVSVWALANGEIRDRFSWIQFEKYPIQFILSFVVSVAFTVILSVVFYLLLYRELYIVNIARRIWNDYKKLTSRRL
ncbi:hypothetical protein NKH55_31775 [Mesorhizobium opportunistum]|uniref:hypothetical protein n=1 Tax=Mesorhizobium opportunistum TaxID=593909 RepID=UPI0033384682